MVCGPAFSGPQFYAWLDEFHPTWYSGVPAIHQAIVATAPGAKDVLARHRLRLIRSMSVPMQQSVLGALEAIFRTPVVVAYGMSEAGQIESNPVPPGIRRPGTVGRPAGHEVAIIDANGRPVPAGATGEVAIRGANVIAGYLNDPAANAEAFVDGWFRTGDSGSFDDGGYLTISGRIKELINPGGQKVVPGEVEAALVAHPAVADAIVFAPPHRSLGEDVAAAVVARAGREVSESGLRAFATQRLAAYKVPHRIVFLDALPLGPTVKTPRGGLAERLGLVGRDEAAGAADPPRAGLETELVEIWQRLLQLKSIARGEDFFVIGGDSIDAAELLLEIEERFGVDIPVDTMAGPARTLAGMACEIERCRTAAPIT